MGLRVLRSFEECLRLLLECLDLVLEYADLILEVALVQFIDVDDVVVSMFANGASEADSAVAILAKPFDVFTVVVVASEDVALALDHVGLRG